MTACLRYETPQAVRTSNDQFPDVLRPRIRREAVRAWLGRIGAKTLYIEPESPWENGYCESLNSKLRDELLNGEMFRTPRERPSPD